MKFNMNLKCECGRSSVEIFKLEPEDVRGGVIIFKFSGQSGFHSEEDEIDGLAAFMKENNCHGIWYMGEFDLKLMNAEELAKMGLQRIPENEKGG